MPTLAVPNPRAAIAAGRGETAVPELERDVARDADRPGAPAGGKIPTGIDEAWPDDCEEVGDPVGRVSLADPAEIEAESLLELDRVARDADAAAARRGRRDRLRTRSAATASNVRS